jgi:hypothetical protein
MLFLEFAFSLLLCVAVFLISFRSSRSHGFVYLIVLILYGYFGLFPSADLMDNLNKGAGLFLAMFVSFWLGKIAQASAQRRAS